MKTSIGVGVFCLCAGLFCLTTTIISIAISPEYFQIVGLVIGFICVAFGLYNILTTMNNNKK